MCAINVPLGLPAMLAVSVVHRHRAREDCCFLSSFGHLHCVFCTQKGGTETSSCSGAAGTCIVPSTIGTIGATIYKHMSLHSQKSVASTFHKGASLCDRQRPLQKKPQPIKPQSVNPSLQNASIPKAQRTLCKRGRKDLKSQRTREFAVRL